MGTENREQSDRVRLDKALTDFLRKRISSDEYEYIRNQSYEEFMKERTEAVRQPASVH